MIPSRRNLLLALMASPAGLSRSQPVPRTIGLLLPWKDDASREIYENLVRQMAVLGYPKSTDFNVVLRSANADSHRLTGLADGLVRLRPNVIVAASTIAVIAAKRASLTVPMVFFDVADPLASGLAESLARPGRNSTGLTNFSADELIAKRLGLLKQLVPNLTRVAYLINPVSASKASNSGRVRRARHSDYNFSRSPPARYRSSRQPFAP